jgi:hypothetical protein
VEFNFNFISCSIDISGHVDIYSFVGTERLRRGNVGNVEFNVQIRSYSIQICRHIEKSCFVGIEEYVRVLWAMWNSMSTSVSVPFKCLDM